jgi:hypothetical protein
MVGPRPTGAIFSERQASAEAGSDWRGKPTREGGDRRALYFDGGKK